MADDIAVLGIRVDSTQIKTADSSLDKLTKTSTKTARATDGLNKSNKKASDGLSTYSKSADKATGATDNLGTTSTDTATATSGMTKAVKAATVAVIAFVSARAAGELKQYADDFVNIQNTIKQVTATTRELNSVTTEVFSIANKTRSAVGGTATLYQRLSIATDELELSQSELLRITETINKAFIVSGATTAEAAGATRQLAQGLAAGALRGDEFNSVAEQAPIIMRAIAKETGLTIGALREFAAEGGITAEIVINALEDLADEVDNRFIKSIATYEQKLNLASNALIASAGRSEDLQAAVGAAGDTVVVAATATGFLLENLGLIASVIIARAIPAIGALIIAQRTLIATTTASITAARGFAAVMALLGGPVGALAIAGVALAAYVTSTNEAEGATDRLTEATQRVNEELDGVFDLGVLTKRADRVRAEFIKVQTELDELERKNREVDIYGSGNLTVAKDRVIELRQKVQELQAELEIVEAKQQKAFDFGIETKLEDGTQLVGEQSNLLKAVEAAKDFADQFKRAVDLQKELQSNLERIRELGEERKERREPTVLGALTRASQARTELRRGNIEKASELALEAARELRAVEEDTGKKVTLAGAFIQNFEKIAQEALTRAEETQKALVLEIVIGDETKQFQATKEGVKEAGKFTSDALKEASKRRA